MNSMQIFSVAGIPVRVTMGFFLLVAYYGYSLAGAGFAVASAVILGVTISILIHEFGHALVARRYKLGPQIELHMWGGLCYHEFARKDSHHALIVLGGPMLQIAVGMLTWVVLKLVQPNWLLDLSWSLAAGFWPAFFSWFFYVSVFWGALNMLVPVWPLDGGQLFRMLMLRFVRPPARAEKIVHVVGLVLSIAIVVYALTTGSRFLAVLAGLWAFENGRWFGRGAGPVPVRLRSELADRLLDEAAKLAQAGDWHEARRLAFQARDEKTVTDDQLARIFELLTVSSAELRDWSEALAWSPKAPRTAPAFVARIRALCALGQRAQARSELSASDAVRLEPVVRAKVEAWVEGTAAP
ncbi:MAG: site-2 protease family protein [Myxococcota bacterium]